MRFDIEWEEAPGVKDRVLAATWARLTLTVDGQCASELIDGRSLSRRTGIYESLFPLAEWLVENWWYLLHEPSPYSPVLGGRAASSLMRSWVQRHNLLAARDGQALPDLTIVRDGDEVVIQWEADPVSQGQRDVRFVGQGRARIAASEFRQSVQSFVDTVLTRTEEHVPNDPCVLQTRKAWDTIQSSDSAEAELCRSLAIMGVDPYNPKEATDELIDFVEEGIRLLPAELSTDLFEGSDPVSLKENLDWVNLGRTGLSSSIRPTRVPTVSSGSEGSAHALGYEAARRVRSELLHIAGDTPIEDLPSMLAGHLGWAAECQKTIESKTILKLDGLVGTDGSTSRPILLVPRRSRTRVAERFHLARAAFFPVTGRMSTGPRLLSSSVTAQHRAARAFAAELLAPAEALRRRVSSRLDDQELESLGEEFKVSAMVIRHQIENHGLGYIQT